MVSDVGGWKQAAATRDRAVVRTGDRPAVSLSASKAHASLLALLLT